MPVALAEPSIMGKRMDHSPSIYIIQADTNKANAEGAINLLKSIDERVKRDGGRLVVVTQINRSNYSPILDKVEKLSHEGIGTEILKMLSSIGPYDTSAYEWLLTMLQGLGRLKRNGAKIAFVQGYQLDGKELSFRTGRVNAIVSSPELMDLLGAHYIGHVSKFAAQIELAHEKVHPYALRGIKRIIHDESKTTEGKLAVAILASPDAVPMFSEGLSNFHPEILKNPNESIEDLNGKKLRLELLAALRDNNKKPAGEGFALSVLKSFLHDSIAGMDAANEEGAEVKKELLGKVKKVENIREAALFVRVVSEFEHAVGALERFVGSLLSAIEEAITQQDRSESYPERYKN